MKMKLLILIFLLAILIVMAGCEEDLAGEAKKAFNKRDNQEILVINYFFKEPTMQKVTIGNQIYDSISLAECSLGVGIPGNPNIPVCPSKNILLPQGTKVKDLQVSCENIKTLDGVYFLDPIQQPLPLLDKEELVNMDYALESTKPNKEKYSRAEKFPRKLNSQPVIQNKKGYSLFNLNLYPVSYYPSTGTITYCEDMSIRIELKEAPISRFFRDSARDKTDIRDTLEVKDVSVLDTYSKKRFSYPESGLTGAKGGPYEYVIITTQEFSSAFQPLINWKTTRPENPITATIVTVEDIENTPEYYCDGVFGDDCGTYELMFNDTAAHIRNFIKDAYANWNTTYVLLGGDADFEDVGGESGDNIIPGVYFWAYVTIPPFSFPILSDMYYSNLDGNFNFDEDYHYGEYYDGYDINPGTGEIDLYSEVYVGRAPVDSIQEVNNFVAKTMAYENAAINGADYLTEALMVGELLWGSPYFEEPLTWGGDYKDEILNNSCANGYCTEGFSSVPSFGFNPETLYDQDHLSGWSYEGGGWEKDEIISNINEDLHIINHLGHANVDYNMKLENSDVDTLINDKYFFEYSQGCFPGAFDNNNFYTTYPQDSIAEHLVVGENGAFAVIMNSRWGFGKGESTDGPSQYFDREFFDAVFSEEIYSLGRANQDSKEDNIWTLLEFPECEFSWNPPWPCSGVMRWVYYELNLLGDPETKLYVPPRPEHDIKVNDIIYPEQLVLNEQTTITAQILNKGSHDEIGVEVKFYANELLINTETIDISAGQTFDLDFYYTPATCGEHYLKINITPLPTEEDLYLGNNILEKQAYVPRFVLTGEYSDYGADWDDDGLFNYLMIEVGVEVYEQVEYQTHQHLLIIPGDCNGPYYCWDIVSASAGGGTLNPGDTNFTILFGTSAIVGYGADDNFTLTRIKLWDLNHSQIFISIQHPNYTTNYYSHTEFNPLAARFTGEYSDYGVDTDDDDQYDQLIINSTVEVFESGTYGLEGSLDIGLEEDQYVSWIEPVYLEKGIRHIELPFEGSTIFSSRFNGPYSVNYLELVPASGTILDYEVQPHQTQPYQYTDFEQPKAFFTGYFFDYGVDTDDDGLYNYINFEVGVKVNEAGTYKLWSSFITENWEFIGYYLEEPEFAYLEEGEYTFNLTYNGNEIYKLGIDGPYMFSILEIVERIEEHHWSGADIYFNAHTTQTYSYMDFDPPNAHFTGEYSDYGIDTNGDGLFEYLAIDVGVDVLEAGVYTLNGSFAHMIYIGQALNSTYLDVGSHQMTLLFRGQNIRGWELDGPYYLVDLNLEDNSGILVDYEEAAYETQFYNYMQFNQPEAEFTGEISDYGYDRDGQGLYEELIVNYSLLVRKEGVYYVQSELFAPYFGLISTFLTEPYLELSPGIYNFNISFDGNDIYNSQTNGPYIVNAALIDNLSSELLDLFSLYTIQPYNYLDFNPNGSSGCSANLTVCGEVFPPDCDSIGQPVCCGDDEPETFVFKQCREDLYPAVNCVSDESLNVCCDNSGYMARPSDNRTPVGCTDGNTCFAPTELHDVDNDGYTEDCWWDSWYDPDDNPDHCYIFGGCEEADIWAGPENNCPESTKRFFVQEGESGDSAVFGEYGNGNMYECEGKGSDSRCLPYNCDSRTQDCYECCGDDEGEYLISGSGYTRCCNHPNDYIDSNGNCQPKGKTKPVSEVPNP